MPGILKTPFPFQPAVLRECPVVFQLVIGEAGRKLKTVCAKGDLAVEIEVVVNGRDFLFYFFSDLLFPAKSCNAISPYGIEGAVAAIVVIIIHITEIIEAGIKCKIQ